MLLSYSCSWPKRGSRYTIVVTWYYSLFWCRIRSLNGSFRGTLNPETRVFHRKVPRFPLDIPLKQSSESQPSWYFFFCCSQAIACCYLLPLIVEWQRLQFCESAYGKKVGSLDQEILNQKCPCQRWVFESGWCQVLSRWYPVMVWWRSRTRKRPPQECMFLYSRWVIV